MNKLIAALKKIRLGKILMVLMAGVLLFVSTACNRVQAKTPNVTEGPRQEAPAGKLAVPGRENPRPEVPGGTATSPSSDVINRFQGKSMNEFSDVDPRAEGASNTAADKAALLRDKAERNVIDETGNIGENTRRILDKKGENVDEIGTNLRRSTEGAKEKAQGTAEDLTKSANRATEDLTKSANRATEYTSNYFQDKANQAAGGTQRNLDKAGSAIKDAVD
jgi:ElaB/YqjD/DUF883 family membrane-anchored ribosome-binding protein